MGGDQRAVNIFGKARRRPSATWRQTTDRAFDLIGDGRLEDAGPLLVRAADLEPRLSDSWYNLALLHKFRRDWDQARDAGLRAVALLDRDRAAPDWWNLGIAATALQDWALARRAWHNYGIEVPGLGGPIDGDFGVVPVRLSPNGESEVVWARRIDPARAEVLSIPLPSSGRRWGEVVLHDGVPHGQREWQDESYPVFDEIELWAPSPVPTFVVVLRATGREDRDALESLVAAAGYAAEDWTGSVRLVCRSCSEGSLVAEEADGRLRQPGEEQDGCDGESHGHHVARHHHRTHRQHADENAGWLVERECGIAAPGELARELLAAWVTASPSTRGYRDLEEVG